MADARLDIAKLEHLALQLGVPLADIRDMARQIHHHVRTEWRRIRGKLRRIIAPKRRLKTLQQRIAGRLLGGIPVAESAHAYRRGRSTFTAAKPHVAKPFLASLDVKDFFPGIHYTRVERLWRELGCSPDVARVLTQLTTYEYHLPLGFATSPAIANLARAKADKRIEGLAGKKALDFTSYSDNLYVSGRYISRGTAKSFRRFVQQSGMRVPRARVQVSGPGRKKEVTGLTVSDGINVPKSYRRGLRAEIRRQLGPGSPRRATTRAKASLWGKVRYVGRVNASQGRKLSAMLARGIRANAATGNVDDNAVP